MCIHFQEDIKCLDMILQFPLFRYITSEVMVCGYVVCV